MSYTSRPRVPFALLLLSVTFLPGCVVEGTDYMRIAFASAWAPWVVSCVAYTQRGNNPAGSRLLRIAWPIFIMGTLLSLIIPGEMLGGRAGREILDSAPIQDFFSNLTTGGVNAVVLSMFTGFILLIICSPFYLMCIFASPKSMNTKNFVTMTLWNYIVMSGPLLLLAFALIWRDYNLRM